MKRLLTGGNLPVPSIVPLWLPRVWSKLTVRLEQDFPSIVRDKAHFRLVGRP